MSTTSNALERSSPDSVSLDAADSSPLDAKTSADPIDPIDWELAARTARRVAGDDPFANSYHGASLEPDFTELTALAEELVTKETGLSSLAGPARARIASRDDWVKANLNSFRRLIRPVTAKLGDKITPGMSTSITRRVAGIEIGSLLGWMSSRVLGQYDLLVIEDENPEDQDLVYYVGPNVLAIEKRYGFPPREFRLWLALHEVTHRAQFTGVPWLREHFLSLVHRTLDSVEPDPRRLLDAIKRAADAVRDGHNPLDDGGLLALLASDEQRVAMNEIGGLMSLLEGHGDVTMNRAGNDLVPSAARFNRLLHERRKQSSKVGKQFRKLIGLEAKMAQYVQGEAFIEAVERERGADFLARVWQSPLLLPTLAEIREPASWMKRLDSHPTSPAIA